jgi:hypothetical protein
MALYVAQPTAVEPLHTASSSDSDIEEPSRQRTKGLLVAGVLAVGVIGYANWGGASSHIVAMKGDGVVVLSSNNASDKAHAESNDCAWGKQNCNSSKCCNNPGMLCYEQTKWYAQCRESCTPGPDPGHWDSLDWSCKESGERKPGTSKCSELGEDCSKTQCCTTVNTQCFQKNEDWATCKTECTAGFPDLTDADPGPWSCKPLGDWTKGAADWVKDKCSLGTDDCTDTHCCAEPNKQCYQQQEYFAQCKYKCPENDWESEWSCKEVGSRTPESGGAPPGKLAPWVVDTCVGENADCRESKCCLNMDHQCFEKNEDWAMCMNSCEAGPHREDKNATWTCKELGPRLVAGLGLKGSPSLFCLSLFLTSTYEMAIVQTQLDNDAGIFQCDDTALLSTDEVTELVSADGKRKIKTLGVEKAEITRTVDGTVGNAKLFMNVWEVIIKDGRWKQHAWIIKVDPDAVIIPYRVRAHLKPHTLENVYVVNCNAFPDSPNFPMMYGSVEIYSFKAIDTYAARMGKCYEDMGSMLGAWGEDYYMTHCLDHIGVGRISDFVSVGDNVCSGGSCSDEAFSAFHPYKDAGAWQNCWDYAHGKEQPAPEWS